MQVRIIVIIFETAICAVKLLRWNDDMNAAATTTLSSSLLPGRGRYTVKTGVVRTGAWGIVKDAIEGEKQ